MNRTENIIMFENYVKRLNEDNKKVPFRLGLTFPGIKRKLIKKSVYIDINVDEQQLRDIVLDQLSAFVRQLEQHFTHDVSAVRGEYVGYDVYEADQQQAKQLIRMWEDKFKELGIYVNTRIGNEVGVI